MTHPFLLPVLALFLSAAEATEATAQNHKGILSKFGVQATEEGVRKYLIKSLNQLNHVPKKDLARKGEIDGLIEQLGSENWRERENAEAKLKGIGDDAVPYLNDALKDPDAEIATRAKHLLVQIRLPVSGDPARSLHSAMAICLSNEIGGTALESILEFSPHFNLNVEGQRGLAKYFLNIALARGKEEKHTWLLAVDGMIRMLESDRTDEEVRKVLQRSLQKVTRVSRKTAVEWRAHWKKQGGSAKTEIENRLVVRKNEDEISITLNGDAVENFAELRVRLKAAMAESKDGVLLVHYSRDLLWEDRERLQKIANEIDIPAFLMVPLDPQEKDRKKKKEEPEE